MTGLRERTYIGAAVVAAFIIAGGLLFAFAIPKTNEQLLTYMLGQLSGLATAIVSFHFGSSRGSEEKTAAMAALNDGTPQQVEVINDSEQPVPVKEN